MSFDELKEKLVSYYPRNITFFGWDLFTRLKLQQTPKLTQEQVQEAVQNATLEQKLQMAEAYRRAENELQKIRTGFGFLGIAFIGGAGAYTLIKRRFPHKIIVPGLITFVVNGSWLYHEPSYIGTYAEQIRPVIDKVYEEQQISAQMSTFPTANEIYSIIQFIVFIWQLSMLKEYKWTIKSDRIDGLVRWPEGYEARFPGLDYFYVQSTQTTINACYVIAIICLVISPIHLITSGIMLYGVCKQNFGVLILWFLTVIPMIILPTIYAVIWWNGNKFDDQLTMSVFEFVLALAITMPLAFIIIFYICRIRRIEKDEKRYSINKESELAYFEKDDTYKVLSKNPKCPIRKEPYRSSTGWHTRTNIPIVERQYDGPYRPSRSYRSPNRISRGMGPNSQNSLRYSPGRKSIESRATPQF